VGQELGECGEGGARPHFIDGGYEGTLRVVRLVGEDAQDKVGILA
jgi:hypothetical protein